MTGIDITEFEPCAYSDDEIPIEIEEDILEESSYCMTTEQIPKANNNRCDYEQNNGASSDDAEQLHNEEEEDEIEEETEKPVNSSDEDEASTEEMSRYTTVDHTSSHQEEEEEEEEEEEVTVGHDRDVTHYTKYRKKSPKIKLILNTPTFF